MAKFRSAVVTTVGKTLIEQAMADKKAVIFSTMKIGDGSYTGSENLETFTSLRNMKNSYAVTAIQRADATTVKIKGTISNTGVTVGYHVNEIGVYAKEDGSSSEVLVAIATAEEADFLPDYASSPMTILTELYLKLSNADNVTFTYTVPTGVYATMADLDSKVDKESGKGLSSENYTSAEKNAVANMSTADAKNNVVTFTQASSAAELESGDTISTLFGKVKAWLKSLAPKNHRSTTSDYGLANSSYFGHVKISDTYDANVSGDGIAASQKSVYDSYKTINAALSSFMGTLGIASQSGWIKRFEVKYFAIGEVDNTEAITAFDTVYQDGSFTRFCVSETSIWNDFFSKTGVKTHLWDFSIPNYNSTINNINTTLTNQGNLIATNYTAGINYTNNVKTGLQSSITELTNNLATSRTKLSHFVQYTSSYSIDFSGTGNTVIPFDRIKVGSEIYSLANNTVTFNKKGFYLVTLDVTVILSSQAHAKILGLVNNVDTSISSFANTIQLQLYNGVSSPGALNCYGSITKLMYLGAGSTLTLYVSGDVSGSSGNTGMGNALSIINLSET